MGMTNGEIIQKVFNCEVCEPIIEDDIIHVIFADKKDSAIGFDWSWWNAEYKEPTTKNDLGVDAVSRKDVYDMLENLPVTVENKWIACMRLAELPSVTPQELKVLDKIDEIITDALDKSTDQKESQTLRWVLDKISEVEDGNN